MATIGTVEGVLKLRNEFSNELDRAADDLDRAVDRMDRAGKEAGDLGRNIESVGADFDDLGRRADAAGGGVSGAGDAARDAGDDFIHGGASAKEMGAALGLLLAVGDEAKDTLEEIGEEIEKIVNRAGRTTEPLRQFGADLKGVFLTGPLAAFSQTFREVNEELDRLGNIRTIRDLGGDISFTDRLALKLVESIGLLADEIREIPSLPERFDLSGLSREERTLAGLATAADRLQNAFDRLEPPETARIARAKELEARLKSLAVQEKEQEVALRRIREEHEKSLAAIKERAQLEELFAETMQMVTQDAQDQIDSTQELAEISEEFNDALDTDLLSRQADLMRELFPEETELRRLDDLEKTLEDIIEKQGFEGIEILTEEQIEAARERIEELRREVEGGFDFSSFVDDIGQSLSRAMAQAIISGDVDSAIDAFANALEAAAAAALTEATASALSGDFAAAGAAGFAGIFTAILGATIDAFNRDDTGRRLTGDVTIGAGGVTTPPDFEEASSQTTRAFQALEDSIVESMTQLQDALRFVIPDTFEVVLADIEAQVRDGQTRFNVNFIKAEGGLGVKDEDINQFEATFDTLEEATGFALREFTQALIAQGVEFDSAVAEFIQGFGEGMELDEIPFENFQGGLVRVQELADQAATSLDGVTEVELALQRIGPNAQALAREIDGLGLSAAESARLVGGQVVASFQALRQQITGEELSVEERRKIAEANAELFNAELELEIARLEADKAALLAEAGIVQEEVKLHGNVIDARSRFVDAEASLFNTELGVMGGFVEGVGAIIRSGVELIGDTSRVLGDALGSLPEEIRKQVEAIQKVIDALRKIGTISPGDINIPGVEGGGIGGVGGGGRPSGPTLQDSIDSLIDAVLRDVEAQQRLVDTLESELGNLENFIRDLRLGDPSPLTPGQQVEELRDQLREAAAAAEMGDVEAIREFQAIASTLRQVGAEAFGTAGSGFEALLREIERLGGDVLSEGNEILEREEDILGDIRDEFADLLLLTRDLHDFSIEQIEAIRAGTDATAAGDLTIVEQLVQGTNQTSRDIRELREELARLGRVIADQQAQQG